MSHTSISTALTPDPVPANILNALLALHVRGSAAVTSEPNLRPSLLAAISRGLARVDEIDGWKLHITPVGLDALKASAEW